MHVYHVCTYMPELVHKYTQRGRRLKSRKPEVSDSPQGNPPLIETCPHLDVKQLKSFCIWLSGAVETPGHTVLIYDPNHRQPTWWSGLVATEEVTSGIKT